MPCNQEIVYRAQLNNLSAEVVREVLKTLGHPYWLTATDNGTSLKVESYTQRSVDGYETQVKQAITKVTVFKEAKKNGFKVRASGANKYVLYK